MPKRLVVFCDGTWNSPDQVAPTNVYKLARALANADEQGVAQRFHYEAGVGTRRLERLRGGAFGVGLSRNVRSCYRFLVQCYEPGDELWFIGFSRGAFTARSTVGLVRNAGILRAEEIDRVDQAYRLYRNRRDETHPNGREAELFRRQFSHPETAIDFVGVFDTVGSLGIPWKVPLLTKRWSFHDTELSSRVRVACHALAIDELRKPFAPTLWIQQQPAPEGQTLRQLWFAGVHSDVGGGYADCALAEVALLWMAEQAGACGLAFEPDRLVEAGADVDEKLRQVGAQVAPDPLGPIHDSLSVSYRILGRNLRSIEHGNGAAVHDSAERRDAELPRYDPPNLAAYRKASA